MSTYWDAVRLVTARAGLARTAEQVVAALGMSDPSVADSRAQAFYGGDGAELLEALTGAGWTVPWQEADYHWVALAPDRASACTYVEGDVYVGDHRPVTL